MRSTLAPALLLVLATVLPALAAAHHPHSYCNSTTVRPESLLVHVDRFSGPCTGVVVSSPLVWCEPGSDIHVVRGVHVLILYGDGCQTGVVVEVLRVDAAPAPVLP